MIAISNLPKSFFLFFAIALSSLLTSRASFAEETTLLVRVQANDAKFIGSSIGGARVIIRDPLTGNVLAEGLTTGSTGNTETIMKQPRERGKTISDENTAVFKAILDIDEPIFVTIEAYGPINKKQAMVVSSTQLWVIPGKDIMGDGIVLAIPGFVVDILSPQTHETISSDASEVVIKANVVMMCGCPVTEGGLWDANQYEVAAILSTDGKPVKTVPLMILEKASTFIGKVNLEAGNYEIAVYAFDPNSGNTGLDKTNIIVRK